MIGVLPKNINMSPRRGELVKRMWNADTTDNINWEIKRDFDGYITASENLQKNNFPEVLTKKDLRAAVKFLKEQDGGLIYEESTAAAFNPNNVFSILDNFLSGITSSYDGVTISFACSAVSLGGGVAAIGAGSSVNGL